MIGGLMGKRCVTRHNGRDVTVRVVEIEQNFNSTHYGQWVCVNEATGRRLHRTTRRLRPLAPEREAEE